MKIFGYRGSKPKVIQPGLVTLTHQNRFTIGAKIVTDFMLSSFILYLEYSGPQNPILNI